ncbi:MAG: muramidase [Phyllobacteriaceae bacterium]|jgi:lysozyme|nr:muramidase [Phyllobacteriaceae bacterium]
MRGAVVAAGLCVLSALVLSGCSASSGVDALELPGPSGEVTSSITPRAPVPGATVPSASVATALAPSRVAASEPAFEAADEARVTPAPVQVAMARPENPARPAARAENRRRIYAPRFGDAKPVNFGRASPHKFAVHGVDVSHWQQQIDWPTLRTQGANFAFIKATEGGKHVDRLFRRNWDAARAAGIPTGAYHFFFWCRSAAEQADWFIRHVPKQPGALPPVLDVEWYGNKRSCPRKPPRSTVLAKMRVFSERLEAHYGQKPIIYTTPDFYEDNLRGQFKDHSFWLRSVAAHPRERYPNRGFAFWQYSGTGTARRGVETQIDLNVFNGTEEGWHNWLAQNLSR